MKTKEFSVYRINNCLLEQFLPGGEQGSSRFSTSTQTLNILPATS